MDIYKDPPNDSRAVKALRALVRRDEDKRCSLHCSKTEWGEDKHDADCPFAMAYKLLHDGE